MSSTDSNWFEEHVHHPPLRIAVGIATSGRPLALIPADKAANANPAGTRIGPGLRRTALIR